MDIQMQIVSERFPDGVWRDVATCITDDPIDAIGVVAGPGAEIVVHGPRPGVAAQAAVLGPHKEAEPCLVRIRLFRSRSTVLEVKESEA